ncbi:A1 cistron-splicing factor [Aspergillus recurvatus]
MSSLTPTPTLLTPHLPSRTLVGIDLITFTSTPNFHGIRDIPPGWHFLYTGTTAGLSLRVGGWFYIDRNGNSAETKTGKDILVWRWNDHTEALEPLGSHQTGEGMRYRANIGGVWGSGGLWGYRSRVPAAAVAADAEAPQKSGRDAGAGAGAGAGNGDIIDEEEEDEGRREWTALTDRLSPLLLSRITGEPTVDWEGKTRWVVTSGSTACQDDDDIPGLDSNPDSNPGSEGVPGAEGQGRPEDYTERQFSFLPVDLKMTWREGAIGRERTEAARDRSWALGEIIHRVSSSSSSSSSSHLGAGGDDSGNKDVNASGEAQILGELQFTFLMSLTLMNYSCMQQWKRLLRLILTCRSAITDRAPFMAEVLHLLLTQLKRADDVEGGLFDQLGNEGGMEGAEFLRRLLKGFRTAMYEVLEDGGGEESPVKKEFGKLEEWVGRELDWELDRDAVLRKGMVQLEDGEEVELEMVDHEEEEYAPVVVDLEGTY